MPGKAKVSPKKTGTAKAKSRSKVGKGDSVVCEVCGLSVVVEEVGGIVAREETVLYCCGEPMKARKAARKAAPKAASSAKVTPRKAKAAKLGRVQTTLSGEPLIGVAGASALVPDPKEDVLQQ
jgi:hypothetical protein